MANRKEEKERLRQEREAMERRSNSEARKRLILGYAVAGVLGAAVVIGVLFAILSGGGSSEGAGDDGGPNVNTMFGVVPKGLEIDNRKGTVPPDVVDGDLTAAAEAAGCDLQLDLKDEGSTHVDPPVPDSLPKYGTNPPTSGDHYPDPLADGAFSTTPRSATSCTGSSTAGSRFSTTPTSPRRISSRSRASSTRIGPA